MEKRRSSNQINALHVRARSHSPKRERESESDVHRRMSNRFISSGGGLNRSKDIEETIDCEELTILNYPISFGG